MLPLSRELWVEGRGPDREVRRMAGLTETANRWARTAGWGAALIIVVAVLVLMRTLPVDRGIDWLDGWIAGLGEGRRGEEQAQESENHLLHRHFSLESIVGP